MEYYVATDWIDHNANKSDNQTDYQRVEGE
jgi:hypothetical protein